MGGSGDWAMPRSSASPVGSMMRPGLEYNNSKAMMPGAMVGRSNSVPGTSSTLQQLVQVGTCLTLLPGCGRDTETDPDPTPCSIRHVCVCVCFMYVFTPPVCCRLCVK